MKFSAAVLVLAYLAAAQAAPVITDGPGEAIAGKFIIVLKEGVTVKEFDSTLNGIIESAEGVTKRDFSKVEDRYTIGQFNGYAGKFTKAHIDKIAARSEVSFIEQDRIVSIKAVEQKTPPSWGLPRISQRNRNLAASYFYPLSAGRGVTAYIIDTGILATHVDFGGRAIAGRNFIADEANVDLNGHGTHVAATIGGAKYGVAKNVRMIGVKVLNKNGSGSTSGVISGINYVGTACTTPKKCVANMSLGGSASQALDAAVNAVSAKGIAFAVAAGNSGSNACNFSPARATGAMAVGATDRNDAIAPFSNTGNCVDILAPGVGITSAWIGSNTAVRTISGTSMASPHVAGVAALYLADRIYASTAALYADLKINATPNKITGALNGAPNQLVYNKAGVA
jgi:subtilisin family serine protease